jgi:hypothetical protein
MHRRAYRLASCLKRRGHLRHALGFRDGESKDGHHPRMADLVQDGRAEPTEHGCRRLTSTGQLRHIRGLRRPGYRVACVFAMLTVKVRPLFWLFVIAFNSVGMADLILDYHRAIRAIRANLPAMAGELGAAYVIPIIYVPLLMITHIAAFYMLLRPSARRASL